MKKIGYLETGLRHGYIRVKNRTESEPRRTVSVDGLRGNMRKAMQMAADLGATHYTTTDKQLAGSTYYCFTVYTFYKE